MTGETQRMQRRVAVAAVVGRTNAGKSTLVNRLVGEKISIVSPVEQTTRNTIRGMVEDPRGQIVLLDTPGLHKAEGPLGRLLNGMARASSAGSDILCVVFDGSHEPQMEDAGWMARVAREKPAKCIFALNKCDLKPFFETMFREAWNEAAAKAGPDAPVPEWVKTCGTKAGGADGLLDAMFAMAEPGPDLFDPDVVTDYPRKLAMADAIREKLLRSLFREIPHEIGVAVDAISERGREWDVSATIYVNRPSQKGIVIGQGGRNVKAARISAERDISEMFGVKAALDLHVKVERNWMKNARLLAEMGYCGSVR